MSDFKLKVSSSGMIDMLNFAKMIPNRKKKLESGDTVPLTGTYKINKMAEKLHPKSQKMTICEIKEYPEAQAKHFILKSEDELALFRAGQYVAVDLKIGDSVLSRAYSLCSSPADAKKGIYELLIKRTQDGFASAWILDNWKVGDEITTSGPEGFCFYEPVRDEKHVIGVAGGSGITAFLAMARAIDAGYEDFKLTILYGVRNTEQIMFREELEALESDKIKVVYVLSDSKEKGYEHGFITKELLKKYSNNKPFSVFMCGPQAMYSFVGKECGKLGLDKKHIRIDVPPAPATPEGLPGYTGDITKEYTLTLSMFGEEKKIPMKASESVLVAIDRAGIKAPAHCRGGECGWCRSKLLSGEYYTPEAMDNRRAADKDGGYIHPCCTYPLSDMKLLLWIE